MKLTFNYGTSVLTLPASVLKKLERATKKDIKVLMFLALDRSLCESDGDCIPKIAQACGMTDAEVASALSYWRGAGILDVSEEPLDSAELIDAKNLAEAENKKKTPSVEKSVDSKKIIRADEIPHYTTDELTGIIERREELKALIDECQRAFGKVFNTSEINIIIGLADYLGLDFEYILMLFAYCGKLDRKSVRTAEKMAFRFVDEGITEARMLDEHLRFLEHFDKIEGKIRTMFGIGGRALTGKEKKLVSTWLTEYKYGINIIGKAYEVTIDSTQKPSIPYAAAIMKRWHDEGLKSLKEIEAEISRHRAEKSKDGGSFNTDEFLNAALRRSFGDGTENA